MKILYNFASRSRPEQCLAVVNNIKELSDSDNYRILLKLDTDDSRLSSYLKIVDEDIVSCQVSGSTSKIDAINCWLADPGSDWDILVNISDDQKFTVKGFDNIIREHCKPDTFVHFPEPYKKAACSVMSIMHRDYFNRFGYVYHPYYYSLWCDIEATEVAKLLGRYRYVPITIFEHNHYSTGAVKDQLYKRNDTYKADMNVYYQRRIENFGLGETRDPFLLIKYATRGRWKMFFDAIDNIYATIRTNQFKIVVSADIDDVEMNCSEVRDFCKRYHNVELHYGNHKSKIEAINADMNPNTMWKWCVNMSDDMKFIVPGWDYKMIRSIFNAFGEDTDFFAHFNDGYVGDKLPTLNVCGRKYYDRFHYLYHPSYKSVSCDAENMFVAMMLDRYHYFEEVYFKHLHPANTKEPSDYIYRRNHDHGKADTVNYFDRLKKLFYIANPVMIPEQMKPFL